MKAILLVAFAALGSAQRADVYIRHNLVSDLAGQADVKDSNLVNPWGIATGPATPFWISDNGTGTSTLYDTQGRPFPVGNPLVVTIPSAGPRGSHGSPTGVVYNGTFNFFLPKGGPASFLFATEDGTIVGWNQASGKNAVEVVNRRNGAVYKGIAIAQDMSGTFLYAANFRAAAVDVFDTNFGFRGSFTDLSLPPGYAPFNVANLGGKLFVTFALQDESKKDDVPGQAHGFISVFLPDGSFQGRFVSYGLLNSPWGMAIAPPNFGAFSNALLVGNFGDGTINAFNVFNGAFIGTLLDASNQPMVIQGLWGLIFGNGLNGGDPGALYFTAGIQFEQHGLFGWIRPQVP